jgi:recombination protein RecA
MAVKKKAPAAAPAASASARALDAFQQKMTKTFGEGVFSMTGDIAAYDVIPTGSIVLDYYLGVGGYVTGRLHEIWGPEGAGKTTMSLIAVREAQRKFPEKLTAWLDVEQRLDKPWAVQHGVDLSRMMIVTPGSAEDVADQLKEICRSGLFSMAVVDSVGAMLPEKAKDKDADESVMGKEAQVITRMVKLNAVEAKKSNTTVLLLNQVRANFGYGADTTTPGGFALKHATTTKLNIKRAGGTDTAFKVKMNGEDRVVGHMLAVNIQRNSVAPAYRTAQFPMFYIPTDKFGPVGIDSADEAATIGSLAKVIQLSGSWYTITFTGERVQGRDALVAALREDPGTVAKIRELALLANAPAEVGDDGLDVDETIADAHEEVS